ncbi:MAG: T9SS type A sorting domain-containing protein [Candidatus Zixiibacteriota bacterium]
MTRKNWTLSNIYMGLMAPALAAGVIAADGLLPATRVPAETTGRENRVVHQCLTPEAARRPAFDLPRKSPWSLPTQALAADFDTTIHILVLRFNFQYENTDDPNTTGRGTMDLSKPRATAQDSADYYNAVGHWIDPPPHDSEYFDAQLRALRTYWEFVSDQKVTLSWDIFPSGREVIYQLPQPMNYYGLCDSPVVGLERFFVDCIQTADTDNAIDFSQYHAIMLFHAGSDRQNDIGFPETCADLFTGFIRFGDSISVDNGATYVRDAVMMPETSSQDGRATALNAVMAHEFGHQLGLVDLYSTYNFMSQLGDFALMDNNGFGTGIDFGFNVGKVFGAIPIYAEAWSRAYLGYVPVVDFRQGSDIRLVAAEVASAGIRIARVPISENEYYLIENRIEDIDGLQAFARVDSNTNVILGPADASRRLNGEYDFLCPGSGMLIYHVDEGVAGLDYDSDGLNNFDDNDLQWDPKRRFISLVEGDGVINFGGNYRSGYGRPEDMYRDDRNTAFTPNTNPQSIDNSGNNTHVYVTDIRRDTITLPGQRTPIFLDSVMRFDVETRGLVNGFPVRAGYPVYGLNLVADDLDGDGTDEVVVASGRMLSAITTGGENFLRKTTGCLACPIFEDTARSSTSPGVPYAVPLYFLAPATITASPVTGDFGAGIASKFVAFGYGLGLTGGRVLVLTPTDNDFDGMADLALDTLVTFGFPVALSFGERLWILTVDTSCGSSGSCTGLLYRLDNLAAPLIPIDTIHQPEFHGLCRAGENLLVFAGTSTESKLYVYGDAIDSVSLGSYYTLGPISVDLGRDNNADIIVASTDGRFAAVPLDTSGATPSFGVVRSVATGDQFTDNPIASDVDLDGLPDIVIVGPNTIYAFGHDLILKSNFPIAVDDRYPSTDIIASPVSADIDRGVAPETVFPTDVGNLYSFGKSDAAIPSSRYLLTSGFPLSAGEKGAGSPVILRDSTGGKLGFLGADGWFYLWDVDADSVHNFWPMGGVDPEGSYELKSARLGAPQSWPDNYVAEQFYNYPNPATDGRTFFRYFLGGPAQKVTLTVYDLSGREVASLAGTTQAGDNEQPWDCSNVTPGVYRCRIKVDFGGDAKTDFTDVAVIR